MKNLMKRLLVLILITTAWSCGKTRRSQAQPDAKASAAHSYPVAQWSGRSDAIDSRWQVKSQP